MIRKFTSAGAVHAELTDDDVTRGIKEAYAAAVDKLQAAEEDGAESPTIAMGQAHVNVSVVRCALAELTTRRANEASLTGGAAEGTNVQQELEDIKKILQVIATTREPSLPSQRIAEPAAPVGGMVSMKANGKCCFEAAWVLWPLPAVHP